MLNKSHNSVVTLAILLTLVGVSKPAKADLMAQAGAASATFTAPDKLPKDSTVNIGASNSTSSIGTSLQKSFLSKYPQAKVNIQTQDSNAALKSLAEGKVDLAAIGRALTAAEKAQGFVSVPISREKIAIVISKNNPFEGNLTIDQFAQIFHGEITDWSEIGGTPGKIQLVDSPNSNDTRQSLPNYDVFQSADFKTGATASQLKQDNIDAMIAKLGTNGIGYAVANDVMRRDDVKVVTMHSTQPDDPRYPFSQPFSLIYQGTPSKAAQAYLGYATTEGGQKVVASRVGSISTAAVTAIASGVGVNSANSKGVATEPATGTKTPGDLAKKGTDAIADGKDAVSANAKKGASAIANGKDIKAIGDADKTKAGVAATDKNAIANTDVDPKVNPEAQGSGEVNADAQGSGEVNPDVKGSGEVNPNVNGSGEVNPDVKGSGEVNPDVNGSGEVNPEVQGSGEPLSAKNGEVDGVDAKEGAVAPTKTADANSGAKVAAKKGQWWWWLIPLLGIPLLAAAIFGGRKKSDQEPALDDIPNINNLDNGSGMPGGSGGGDIPPVGVNASGGLGNVAENTANSVSNLGTAGLAAGGAALAGGAAAAANLAGRRNRAENVADADMDLDLDLDESTTIEEIPSNPVTEFTGQATKLQFDDQSEDLAGDGNVDLDEVNASIADDVALGSAAGIGGVAAASGFAQDAENRTEINIDTESFDVEEVGLDANVSQFSTEQPTDLAQTNTETSYVEALETEETDRVNGDGAVSREFTGDFVLEEESKVDLSTNVDLDSNAEGTGIIDGVTQAGGAAIAGGAAALGGAAAAATGFFNRGDGGTTEDAGIDARIEVPDSEQNTDLDTDANLVEQFGEGFNNVSTNVTENVSNLTENITIPDLDPNLDTNQDPNAEGTGIIDGMTQGGGAAIAGGAAALGGAAAAATGFFNRGDGGTTEDAGIDARIEVPDSEQNTDLDTDANLTGNVTTPDLDPNLDTNQDPNAEGTGIIDGMTQAGGAAIAGGAAALGGAAAATSGFFNRDSQETSDVQEFESFESFESFETSLDTTEDSTSPTRFADNVIADAETISPDLDHDNGTVDASLEEITFDDATPTGEISLDDFTFEDTDSTINTSLEEITLEDATITAADQDINLEELGFEETSNSSDERFGDLNNISEWLDSLETPNQDRDNIADWLDTLDKDSIRSNPDAAGENINQETTDDLAENDDISFQFLEDLLDRDAKNNPKNQ
jgi:ABC-type phosphate transport system substrate-binding protein